MSNTIDFRVDMVSRNAHGPEILSDSCVKTVGALDTFHGMHRYEEIARYNVQKEHSVLSQMPNSVMLKCKDTCVSSDLTSSSQR